MDLKNLEKIILIFYEVNTILKNLFKFKSELKHFQKSLHGAEGIFTILEMCLYTRNDQ